MALSQMVKYLRPIMHTKKYLIQHRAPHVDGGSYHREVNVCEIITPWAVLLRCHLWNNTNESLNIEHDIRCLVFVFVLYVKTS